MDAIFHEKQEGALCAQHCLNALLQGNYFTAVDLADIARQLDESEREHMAVAGVHSEEYRKFLEQPSGNFDDSGYFSVQVINKALAVWSVDLVPYNSPAERGTRNDPTQGKAFICNFKDHWFAVRKLGHQWFNLNSLLTGPELISDTYLSLFLNQLQQEGYSIFIATGTLPDCEADELLRFVPAVQPIKPSLISESQKTATQEDDPHLQEALAMSKGLVDSDDSTLQKALQMSMEGYYLDPSGADSSGSGPSTSSACQNLSQDELREKRLAFLNKSHGAENTPMQNPKPVIKDDGAAGSETNEDEMLAKAIAMSMENP